MEKQEILTLSNSVEKDIRCKVESPKPFYNVAARLERDVFEFFQSLKETRIGYLEFVFTHFQQGPVLVSDGQGLVRLAWCNVKFVTKPSTPISFRRFEGSRFGYEPMDFLRIALSGFNQEAIAPVLDRFLEFSESRNLPTSILFKNLFCHHRDSIHVIFCTAMLSAANVTTRSNIYKVACALNASFKSKQVDRLVNKLTGTITLRSSKEDQFVQKLRLASGACSRKKQIAKKVQVQSGGQVWDFWWQDCVVKYSNRDIIYERQDERINWVCHLLDLYLSGKITYQIIPISVLLFFSD